MNWKCLTLAVVLVPIGCDAKTRTEEGEAERGPELYASPPGVELPFRTNVPDGIRVEIKHFEQGPTVTFVAFTGDELDERAFLHFVVAPESFTEQRGRVFVRQIAESYRIPGARTEVPPLPPPSWAAVKYPVDSRGMRGAPITGWVALGRHNGRWFHILLQHPEWAEDRVTAQMQQILDSWRWTDDGTPLQARVD